MREKEDWYSEFLKETKDAPNPVEEELGSFIAFIEIFGVLFIIGFIIEAIWMVIT